jgi:hypothetical protein
MKIVFPSANSYVFIHVAYEKANAEETTTGVYVRSRKIVYQLLSASFPEHRRLHPPQSAKGERGP